MTKRLADQVRKLAFRHHLDFWIEKDRNLDYTVFLTKKNLFPRTLQTKSYTKAVEYVNEIRAYRGPTG